MQYVDSPQRRKTEPLQRNPRFVFSYIDSIDSDTSAAKVHIQGIDIQIYTIQNGIVKMQTVGANPNTA